MTLAQSTPNDYVNTSAELTKQLSIAGGSVRLLLTQLPPNCNPKLLKYAQDADAALTEALAQNAALQSILSNALTEIAQALRKQQYES